MLERRGVISGYEGSKPRQVLIGEGDVPRVLAALAERAGPRAVPGSSGRDALPAAALPAPDSGEPALPGRDVLEEE